MQAKLSRRTFVKDVAVAAVAAGTSSIGSVRAGAAAARIPCGCRDGHLSLAGKPDAWANMKALGAECIESVVEMNMVCPNLTYAGGKHTLDTEDNVRRLKDDLAASGCRITAFAMGNRFDERLEAELEWARKLVKAADRLGVDAIRIDVWPRKLSQDEIVDRCIHALINEGARVLDDGIAQRASDIDVVYLTGYGFPLYRGGPMLYADSVGLFNVLRRMREFAANPHADPAFWQPAARLAQLAAEGKTFNG